MVTGSDTSTVPLGAATPTSTPTSTLTSTLPPAAPPPAGPPLAGLVLAALALAAAVVVGAALDRRGLLHLGATPLSGRLRDVPPWGGLAGAAATAAALVAYAPRLALRLGPVALPLATAVGAAGWALALALVDGPRALTAPLLDRHDYLADLPRVDGPLSLLAGFAGSVVRTPGVEEWATHVAGHPPGALLLFFWADRVGLGGPGWAATLVIAAGASAAAAAVVTVRALAGPAVAAAAAPLLVLAPYALWVATSADAVFLGVSAWGVGLLALAVTTGSPRAAGAAALGAGLLLGSGLHLSYGLLPFGAVAVAVLLAGRRDRLVPATLLAAAGVLVVALAYALAGLDWFEALAATRARWGQGYGAQRPLAYTLWANLAVAALAVGPAAVAGLGRLRALPGRLQALVAGGLVAVLLADASGLTRAEVERIWLPFLPWVLLAALALGRDGSRGGRAVPRGWLAAQAGCALAVTAVVRTTW